MKALEKTTFILHNEYMEQVNMLDDAQAGQLFRAILLYANAGEVAVCNDAMVTVMFSFIRQQMDKDSKKYEEICKRRAEAGKKGGRPRKEIVVESEAVEKPNGFFEKQTKANESKKSLYDNEYECEDDNECDSEYENDSECYSGDGGKGEGDTRTCAREVIHIFDDQYPTTQRELKKFQELADELFVRYAHKQPTEHDLLQVFENTHGIGVQADDSHIAVYDSDKADLLRYAFNLAANADKVNWGYINGIYANFRRRGIANVDDAYRDNWERKYGPITA